MTLHLVYPKSSFVTSVVVSRDPRFSKAKRENPKIIRRCSLHFKCKPGYHYHIAIWCQPFKDSGINSSLSLTHLSSRSLLFLVSWDYIRQSLALIFGYMKAQGEGGIALDVLDRQLIKIQLTGSLQLPPSLQMKIFYILLSSVCVTHPWCTHLEVLSDSPLSVSLCASGLCACVCGRWGVIQLPYLLTHSPPRELWDFPHLERRGKAHLVKE